MTVRDQLFAVLRGCRKGELCLIAKDGTEERINFEVDGYVARLPADRDAGALRLPGIRAGSGGRAPLDPSKLLLDPYGKSFHGDFDFTQALFSYDWLPPVKNEEPTRSPVPRRRWWIRWATP